MSIVLLGQYRNQNERRNYPFADNASLLDADGIRLPVDFLIDAFLYPIELQGGCWLSRIDTGSKTLYFADTVTGQEFGSAEWADGLDTAYCYETAVPYGRPLGTVVFGPGLQELYGGAAVRTFGHTATALAPAAFTSLMQRGVRGLLLPDKTLVTGDALFIGINGVQVTTTMQDGEKVLSIDMLGAPQPTPEDCRDLPPPIAAVCCERAPGSLVVISDYAPGCIALAGWGITLDDICAAQRARVLPDAAGTLPLDSDEICNPVPPPVPPVIPDDAATVCVTAQDTNSLHIIAPSTPLAANPISVKNTPDDIGVTPRLPPVPAVSDISQLDGMVHAFSDPAFTAGTIRIGLKGQRGQKLGVA